LKPTLIAAGARAPLGMTSLQVAMSARADKLEPRSTRFVDKRGRSVGVCLTGGIGEDVHGFDRLLALARPALREAGRAVEEPTPLILALPEAERPDDDPRLSGAILAALAETAEMPLDLDRSRVVRADHAGGALAFEAALDVLLAGAPAVLVGGVDSYYHPEVLEWLDRGCRLHALEAEDGFIPSEAAAFVLLAAEPPRSAGATRVVLSAVATGRETTTDEQALAASMTNLVHRLIGDAPRPLRWVLSDLNGEEHRVAEWSKVAIRTSLSDAVHQRLPDALGDVGAATAPAMAAIALEWWRAGCAPADAALALVHSEGVERGGLLLEADDRFGAQRSGR